MSYPIAEIRFRPCKVILRRTFRTALGEEREGCAVYLAIIDKRGNVGYGEIAPSRLVLGSTCETVLELLDNIRRAMLNSNSIPLEFENIDNILNRFAKHNPDVRAGIDIAVLDLVCREFRVPLWKYLGSSKKILKTDITVSLDDPEEMRKEISEYISRGFDILKIKLGDPQNDLRRIEILEEFNDKVRYFRIDANQGWKNVKIALKMLYRLDNLKIEVIEQPLPRESLRELSYVKKNTKHTIILDESIMNIRDVITAYMYDACDGINIKLMKFGGIRPACTACEIARNLNLDLMIGCMLETKVSITAAACIAARYDIDYVDLDSQLLISSTDIPVRGGIVYDGDKIVLPDGPGLGIEIDI